MTGKLRSSDSYHTLVISRRHIIKLAAAAGLLAGCRSIQKTLTPTSPPSPTPTPSPTTTPTAAPTLTPTSPPTALPTATPTNVPTATSPPTSTAAPTATPTPAPTATSTATPAAGLSRVVHTRHAAVWSDDALVPQALRHMLDASITTLTGLDDADGAWASLFSPGERVAIKVNTIGGSSFWTHVPLVMSVTERLQEIGVPAEHIVIFDRRTNEMEWAGYPVNHDGNGVRCYGTDGRYSPGWTIMDDDVALSDILLDCGALINIPILKYHGIAGISFAMKNHYGTFDRPGRFHQPRIGRAIAELNALEPIKDRTRLIIGDALKVVSPNWYAAETGDSILMSLDPVSHDTVGLHLYNQTMLPDLEFSATPTYGNAAPWLANGAEMGLGTNDRDKTDLLEVTLG